MEKLIFILFITVLLSANSYATLENFQNERIDSPVGMQWYFSSFGKKALDKESLELLLADMRMLIDSVEFDDFLAQELGAKAQSTRVYIKVIKASSPEYFLSFRPKFKQIPGFKKQYIFTINPIIFHSALSQTARLGILAHEMMHLLDYLTSKKRQVVAALSQLRGGRMLARYERQTDLRVVRIGSHKLSSGLTSYRHWVYARLTNQAAVDKKKREYLTPREIELASCIQGEDESLISRWTLWGHRRSTPLNFVEMQERSLGHCQ